MNPLEGASPALTGHATDALESLIVRSQPPGSSRVRHASRLSRFYKNGALYSFSIAVNNPSDILFRPHQLSSTLTNSHRLSFSSALISPHQPSALSTSQQLSAALIMLYVAMFQSGRSTSGTLNVPPAVGCLAPSILSVPSAE